MLYDPKWEVETKADPFKLKTLVAWLEHQPKDEVYCYVDNGSCLLARYFTAMGFDNVCMYTDGFLHGPRQKFNPGRGIAQGLVRFPCLFDRIATAKAPYRTFGAALYRARELHAPAEEEDRNP